MSAGCGVRHSEFNASHTDPVRLLQIWIEPSVNGIEPGYEEKHFSDDEKHGQLRLIASPGRRDDSVTIHQDARVYVALFKAFMDASSKVWATQGWKDKIAAGLTHSASQGSDKFNTLTHLFTFAMQHGMIWTGLGLLPGNNSSKGRVNDLNRLESSTGTLTQSNADQGADAILDVN